MSIVTSVMSSEKPSYTGISTNEILLIAADIVECAPKNDIVGYVINVMIPAAEQHFLEYGDEITCGYRISSVIYNAEKIAQELEKTGKITI